MRSHRHIVRFTLALAAASLAVATAATAEAAMQIPVKTSRAFEQAPGAGGGTYFAWSKGSAVRLMLQSAPGQPAIQVNGSRSNAWAGSIDGTALVYQQARAGRSDIKLFDVVSHHRSEPAGINTRHWEWHPTISGPWILFGRRTFAKHRSRVLLHNTSTNATITLADVRGRNAIAHPGQVSGTWAVWDVCAHGVCNVYRYDITTRTTTKVPNTLTGKEQYYPSVTSTGTVYFAHSGFACGQNVRLVEWVPGTTMVLVSFRAGRDLVSTTQTVPDQVTGTDVYYDRYTCRTGAADIYKVVVP
jgi:hypothetical protein